MIFTATTFAHAPIRTGVGVSKKCHLDKPSRRHFW